MAEAIFFELAAKEFFRPSILDFIDWQRSEPQLDFNKGCCDALPYRPGTASILFFSYQPAARRRPYIIRKLLLHRSSLNFLEQSPEWEDTAVILTYDDSDGWYDHQASPIVNSSAGSADFLNGSGVCGDGEKILPGIDKDNPHALGRCAYGPRLPLLVVSPWAKRNYVDHQQTDQTSIIRFIEDNWLNGMRIGNGSFDVLAGSIEGMFNFRSERPENNERIFWIQRRERFATLTGHLTMLTIRGHLPTNWGMLIQRKEGNDVSCKRDSAGLLD